MRFAIFGDIHANLEALEVILADARNLGATNFICLGDVVGYNANPHECLEIVQSLRCPVVKGNHDEYAASDSSLEHFNPLAELAIRWTRDQLEPRERTWLANLPLISEIDQTTIVHATLDEPASWTYVLNQLDAASSFANQTTDLCFFGHTHAPRVYVQEDSVTGMPLDELVLEHGKRYFINVGSVGQPRDGDWRAAYVIFDSQTRLVKLRRLAYGLRKTQEKIVASGLPPRLAERLAFGK
ncbi:MAG: metallophosphoesterase family protein [Verrucomicrobia bacterium]|nr:metallophosphoesterase family protein [Verrucomicrobiota bacterium]MBV9673742.1 metallophosphoesterase family protein [Verrucomicrobiota bacterium]